MSRRHGILQETTGRGTILPPTDICSPCIVRYPRKCATNSNSTLVQIWTSLKHLLYFGSATRWNHLTTVISARPPKQAIYVDSIITMFETIGSLYDHAWIVVLDNLAVDTLLGTSFINCRFLGIFLSKRKILPWNARPVPTLTTFPAISLLF